MVDHLPSTMNLYKTRSSQGTRTVATKPVGPLFRRTERVHYWKKKKTKHEKSSERAGPGAKFVKAYLIKASGDDNLVGVVGPGEGENVNQKGGGRQAKRTDHLKTASCKSLIAYCYGSWDSRAAFFRDHQLARSNVGRKGVRTLVEVGLGQRPA